MTHSRKPRILVFASGDKEGGGSGFQEMVEYSRTDPPVLNAEIVAVVSNHPQGGVSKKAKALGVTFEYWPGPFTAEGYQHFVQMFQADWVMLSGWLKLVRGLDPKRTVNIHPAMPISRFGGPGMWGHHVHEAVSAAYKQGEITQTGVTMHFVTEEFDRGPIIWQRPVLIRPDDTPESIAKRVNEVERTWQSHILNLVVQGDIYLGDDTKVYYRGD
jgi:folate-dependent phosphoribosylglycinamide formyltransferase PurN